MKIGIMSDSHDNVPAIAKAVGFFNDAGVSLVIHARDLVSPFVSKPMKELEMEFEIVFGNNDGERLGLAHVFGGRIRRPPHIVLHEGRRILVLHEPDNLDALIASSKPVVEEEPAFYQTWWFWTLVGGAVAAAAGGAIYATSSGSNQALPSGSMGTLDLRSF